KVEAQVLKRVQVQWEIQWVQSGEVLSVSHGRNLRAYQLPSRKCKVDFMKTDYSPLGACHAPFPPSVCCEGFKEIACAAVDLINDMRTDCATNMFIGIYRHNPFLPPDYFRNTCVEGPKGLDCLPIFQGRTRGL
ncbi:hypothetical protein V2J09_002618, partial [Rumex salicifolius]